MSKFKFDVIIGNPPYQEEDGGSGASAKPLYNLFVEEAVKTGAELVSFITPSKWFAGGKGLDGFRAFMLNSNKIDYMVDYPNAKDVFGNVSVGGGVSYFLYNAKHVGLTKYTNIHDGRSKTMNRDLSEFPVFVRYNEALEIIRKIQQVSGSDSVAQFVRPRNPFGISSNVRGSSNPIDDGLTLISSGGTSYIGRDLVTSSEDLIGKNKVIISKVTSEHAGEPDKSGRFRVVSTNQIITENVVNTDSYLVVYASSDKKYAEAYLKYLGTRFFRFLLLQAVTSINLSKDKFNFVPNQDFSEASDIDWSQSVDEIDAQLFDKYSLSKEEVDFIYLMMKELK